MKIKKFTFLLLYILCFVLIGKAQNKITIPQDSTADIITPSYKLGVGIRLPLAGIMLDPGLSAKYFFSKKTALETSFGWNIALQELNIALFATRNHRLFRQYNLRMFYGAGISGLFADANMRTQQFDHKKHFYLGAGITAGLEYPLQKKPFVFGAEYRQVYYRFAGQDIYSKHYINTTFGLTVKYRIK